MANMRPTKYIFLSSSTRGNNLKHYELDSEDFFVGSWAGLIARRLKAFDPKLDISIWRTEPVVSRHFEKSVFGLDGVIWPSRGIKIIKNVFTLQMLLNVIKLSFSYKIVLHYHSIFNRFIFLRFLLPPNVKIVLSHHGGVPPDRRSLKHFFLLLFCRHASAITYLTNEAREYFKEIKVPDSRLFFLPVGADFESFIPSDKKAAREKLGLDTDVVYGIYVGSFFRVKSVDIILNIYNDLKRKYNFKIIFVGGENNEDNDLYNDVLQSGCPFYGRQPWVKMKDFYNAADFYIHPMFYPQGGLDVSWIEALACNVPVMSPQLLYLDFDHTELGVVVENPEESLAKTEYMITNHKKYQKCREVAIKYLDANKAIMKRLKNIYKSI